MSDRHGWSELLARMRSPGDVHERTLQMAREDAAGQLAGTMERVIVGADEALAAVAIARGAAACRDFPPAIASVVERIGHRNETFPNAMADLGILRLLSLVAISEAVGAPLTLPRYDPSRQFARFLVNNAFSRTDKITAALLALHLGRVEDARLIIKTVGTDRPALVSALLSASVSKSSPGDVESAFDGFLRDFPADLSAQTAEWRQLMLAAMLVIGKSGGTPVSEVADELHRRVEKLAAGESA